MGRCGKGGWEGSQPALSIGCSVAAPVTVNKPQIFKPLQLMPSATAIYLLKGRQGLSAAIKLFASSAFKYVVPLAKQVICSLWACFLPKEGFDRKMC